MKFSFKLCLKAMAFMMLSLCAGINAENRGSQQQIARGDDFRGFEGGSMGAGHNEGSNAYGRDNRSPDSREYNHSNAAHDTEAYRYGENKGAENTAGYGAYGANPVYVAPPVQYAPNGAPFSPSGNDNWGQ
jgi:hypothetical protein